MKKILSIVLALTMGSLKRVFVPALLVVCLLLGLCGCGASGKYKIVKTLEKQSYSIGFRSGDSVAYYVTGALEELQADGTVTALSRQWFGDDRAAFSANADALKAAGDIPQRTLLVGVDENAYPVSYKENGEYAGFDVELAKKVCEKLGWEARFLPIQAKDAYVELSSGNVDVAWGGLALDTAAKNYTVFGPYMTNELVIAALSGTGSGVGGKTLVMSVSQDAMSNGLVAADGSPAEVFADVALMKREGLAVPATTEVEYQLNQNGFSLPLSALTVEQCADTIAAALKKL